VGSEPIYNEEPFLITTNLEGECKEGYCIPEEDLPNPVSAGVVAVFPGILIHGLGHFYLKDYNTGLILLGFETIGVILGISAFGSCNEWDFYHGGGGANKEGYICGAEVAAGIFFYGSWLYDVIGAPIKASNMRKEYEKKKEKENILKPEIGFMPLRDKVLQSSSGEVPFPPSYYKYYEVQNASADLRGGMILLTWRW
jgi:TM2 domain-containing membrane protein YozV